jgi:hypothetical protein
MLIGVDWHSSEMASFLARTAFFITRHPGFFRGNPGGTLAMTNYAS